MLWEKEKKVIFTCPDSSSPLAYLPREGEMPHLLSYFIHLDPSDSAAAAAAEAVSPFTLEYYLRM